MKVTASATIASASTGPVGFRLYKGTALQYEMFYMKQGYNEQSGSGFHILSCVAGDVLSLKSLGVCSVRQTNCSYEILEKNKNMEINVFIIIWELIYQRSRNYLKKYHVEAIAVMRL